MTIHISKTLAVILALFVGIHMLHAQKNASPSTRLLLKELQTAQQNKTEQAAPQTYATYTIQNQTYIAALVWVDASCFHIKDLQQMGIQHGKLMGDVLRIHIPITALEAAINYKGFKYIDVGETHAPDLARAIVNTRARDVHNGAGGLSRAYTGKGVVIGVIDWGFDYTHPVFYDSTFNRLRIARAWDQNKQSGPAPAGYYYGAAYHSMQELLQAQSDTEYVFGPTSHGTHVAGIAAAQAVGNQSYGHAPEAELIFISYRRDAPAFMDAVQYISDYADSVGKPFVINMSFGNHQGPHDGTGLENRAIDAISGQSKVFVGSAGNNGDANFHLQANLTGQDTVSTVVGFASMPNQFGQFLSMWGSPNTGFSTQVLVADASNNTLAVSAWYASVSDTAYEDTLIFRGTDTVICRVVCTAKSSLNDRANIRFEVRNRSNAKVVLHITADTSNEVHVWNVVRLNNRITNWGVALTNNYPGAIAGNTEFGVGVPAGVGREVITVASHLVDLMLGDSIVNTGSISSFSSRGPTLDRRVKPDISGPGQSIVSAVSSFDPDQSDAFQRVTFNGKSYPFAAFSGTSMSAPAVTGVVALMLEVNKFLTARQIKQILQQTARTDAQTGTIPPQGSLTWGFGKANALAAVLAAESFTHTKEVLIHPNDVVLYPNPAKERFEVAGFEWKQCEIIATDGQLIATYHTGDALQTNNLPQGLYLVRLSNGQTTVIKKLWVQ
jgi:subtilisin family serine protease